MIPGHWHFLVTAELEFSFGKSTNLSVIGLAPQLVDFGQSHLEVCILNVSPDGQVLEYAVNHGKVLMNMNPYLFVFRV